MIVAEYLSRFFSDTLLTWHYTLNKREMPWKGEKDPYKIWLSEIILQQTRVEQGWPYYLKFIERYPTVESLANATDESVFKAWEGLGYYSRCRNLLAGARQIVKDHNGIFPTAYESILSLKGVGPYTAAAIASFAFGLPFSVVDGNVIRVLARFLGIETPFDTSEGKKKFAIVAQQLLDKHEPAAYNQAIMDFGATVCKPAGPLCNECPMQSHCIAYNTGQITVLPVRSKKMVKKKRWFLYFVIFTNDHILIGQRQSKDIWQNLHQFYLVEHETALEWSDMQLSPLIKALIKTEVSIGNQSPLHVQQLTHQTIYARFIEIKVPVVVKTPDGYEWALIDNINKLAFPKIINSYLAKRNEAPLLLF
jgi:A/G-specific adenine glycosylase